MLSTTVGSIFSYLKNGDPENQLCQEIEDHVVDAINHKQWEVEYMTLQVYENEIREEAFALMQKLYKAISPTSPDHEVLEKANPDEIIKLARKYNLLNEK